MEYLLLLSKKPERTKKKGIRNEENASPTGLKLSIQCPKTTAIIPIPFAKSKDRILAIS